VADAAGVEVVWRPFLLGPIFAAQGMHDSPFNLHAAKGRYMWRDLERLCEGYGLPFRRPSCFPRNGLLAARVAIAAEDAAAPWLPAFVRAVYHANFASDIDIGDRAQLARVLDGLGVDAEAVLVRARCDANKERLRRQTARANDLGIFGAPSFVVGGELFWGNDRMGAAFGHARLGG